MNRIVLPDELGQRVQRPIDRVLRPIQRFFLTEGASGIALLAFTAIALLWANSPWGASYDHFWHTEISFRWGDFELSSSLLHWIDDGLMTVFFFFVGLEIKREVLVGELASLRKSALPLMAALGGMIFPAIIYAAINWGEESISGWGIPMATDIAFAIGIMALLGKRVPASLAVFLTALAIADDLGAVLVIAIFYTSELSIIALGIGLLLFLLAIGANSAGVRNPIPYTLIGIAMWVAFLSSGVHATIAGVILAMAIPAQQRINLPRFLNVGRYLLDRLGKAPNTEKSAFATSEQAGVIQTLEDSCEQVMTPLQRMEHGLEGWVMFLIMPVFALANAGVVFGGNLGEEITSPVGMGIILGLVVGKQVGVTLFSWLSVKLGFASLPSGVTWRHIYGASWLAGIGFTMSLFISSLAFGETEFKEMSKIGILAASIIAGVVGFLILRTSTPVAPSKQFTPAEDGGPAGGGIETGGTSA